MGPFANPNEVYSFYNLPYCAPNEIEIKREDLGPLLKGDRPMKTLYDLRFRESIGWKSLCKKHLDSSEVVKFRQAIVDDYYFEMMLDELPIWGYVGELETHSAHSTAEALREARASNYAAANGTHYFLFTHLDFSLAYNGDRIIEVNVSADPLQRVDLAQPGERDVEFSYSVRWVASDVPFSERMTRYAQYSFLPQSFEIHWLSIINSFVLVLLLTGFLSIILMRVLKNDFSRYATADEDDDDEEETGWKLVHGDVFRLPGAFSAFCAYVGTGAQLFSLIFFLLVLAVMNIFYPGNRGAMYTAAIVLYALTAGTAGFVSAHMYCRFYGAHGRWAWNLVLSATLFPAPFLLTFCFLNTVAIAYNSQAALPFGTIVVIMLIWALVTLPLTVGGGIVGRNLAKGRQVSLPTRVNKIPREIPPIPWYRQGPCQVFMAGFLPFSAIYIELHYIFASVWGHKLYTLYGILFIAFLMLIIVTSFITVALTYFQLAIEVCRRTPREPASLPHAAARHASERASRLPAACQPPASHLPAACQPPPRRDLGHPPHRASRPACTPCLAPYLRAPPTTRRLSAGSPMVVALALLGRLHRVLRVRLLLLLLLRALRHVRIHADVVLLRLHADGLVRAPAAAPAPAPNAPRVHHVHIC